jgi:hypothetical protein
VFLGKCSVEFQKEIKEKRLDRFIKTYTDYVNGKEMLRTIKNADAVAFLIDKNIGGNCYLYNRYKASGSSVFCLSFGVPCIVSSDFLLDRGLSEKAVVYNGTHFEQILSGIRDGNVSKDFLKKLKTIPVSEQYSYEYQRDHYRMSIGVGKEAGK